MTEQGELFQNASADGPSLTLDDDFYAQGITDIIGIDEAGRGPLAGPVTAAAAYLSREFICQGINDSKKLDEKSRETIFTELQQRRNVDIFFGVGFSSAEEIDAMGILPANFLAMRRALNQLNLPNDRSIESFCLVIDGRDRIPDMPGVKQIPVVRGDSRARCIATASILAKVSRDREMLKYADDFPQYGFEKHKGYGTRAHMQALNEYGPCQIHRKTFAPVRRCMSTP